MKIVGYTDRLSVAPGEKIRFMVSCESPSYRADIVRLIHGDTNPAGPGFKEEAMRTAANGEYSGREQDLLMGSYVTVADDPLLRRGASFTLQAWIYPTTPQKGVQGILTKWSTSQGEGYGLFVDQDGSLALWIGDGRGHVERVSTGVPLRSACWYFVSAVYHARNRRIRLYQEPVTMWLKDDSRAVTESRTQLSRLGENQLPMLFAAHWDQEASGNTVVGGHYNGKIDSPRLFGRALNHREIESLSREASPARFGDALIASWDFSRDFSSAKVTDTSPHGLHGRTVNMPARAMTSHNWKGNETNFNLAPKEYGAIYFHDDDLENANWEVDFEITVPKRFKSGVYAARLRAGEGEGSEDYVPFFVRPNKGSSTAPIAFLAPTASYMAYANYQALGGPEWRAKMRSLHGTGYQFEYPVQPQDKYVVEHKLLSLYDRHTDGSGVGYSSRLRPMLNMRPKYSWPRSLAIPITGPHPHQFNADLHLVDWLEAKRYRFDVVTDEDLHAEGVSLLTPYRVVLTGSHPEYWSGQMLDSLEAYLANGGRLMYLGGNGFYWVISFSPERLHVIELRRWGGTESWEADPGEYYHSTTGEPGGLWRFRGHPPQKLVGVGFTAMGSDHSLPFIRQPGSNDPRAAFIFEGIGRRETIGDFGLVMRGAGGYEVDRADVALGTPPHTLVLATVTGFSDAYQHAVEEVLGSDSKQGGTVNLLVKGDLVYFEGPKGGAVFSASSISWCGSLSHNNYDNNVSRITDNVLRKFASEDTLS
jgi:N,N-dimethylformamidase